jgi:hypothetical protein
MQTSRGSKPHSIRPCTQRGCRQGSTARRAPAPWTSTACRRPRGMRSWFSGRYASEGSGACLFVVQGFRSFSNVCWSRISVGCGLSNGVRVCQLLESELGAGGCQEPSKGPTLDLGRLQTISDVRPTCALRLPEFFSQFLLPDLDDVLQI